MHAQPWDRTYTLYSSTILGLGVQTSQDQPGTEAEEAVLTFASLGS